MKQVAFDTVFKITLLLMAGYFLYILTSIESKINDGVGRFQYIQGSRGALIDTKTGTIYQAEEKSTYPKIPY